jgi:hypothetical protein
MGATKEPISLGTLPRGVGGREAESGIMFAMRSASDDELMARIMGRYRLQ